MILQEPAVLSMVSEFEVVYYNNAEFEEDNAGFEGAGVRMSFHCSVDRTRSTMSDSTTDKSVRTRLLSLQDSFFQSLQGGSEALAAFCHELTGFNEAVSLCEPDLEDETCHMIYAFAQMSNAVIPAVIDVYVSSDKITEELNKVLIDLSLDDTKHPGPLPFLLVMVPF